MAGGPEDWIRQAERLATRGGAVLETLGDGEILAAWEAAVEAFLDPASPERRGLTTRLARATRLSAAGLQAGLEAVLGGVRGEPTAALFARARTLRDGRHDGRAPDPRGGLLLVILASNLPALAVQPLLPALAARRPVLLKSPAAEPLFAPAFARALARRLPPLAEAVATASWRGGDEAVEAPLLARAETVLAYGGDEAIASLRRRAAAAGTARFVAYGARTSMAVLAREAEPGRTAAGIARDVALFDQRGCLSVAAVYAEGDAARSREVARALAGELGELAERWPPGPAETAELAGVRQVRSEAALRGLAAPAVAGAEEDPRRGTVVIEPRAGFRPTPGLRTVRVHPVDDLAALPAILEPWRGRLQGAALAGRNATALVGALEALGVSRTAPPGELQSPDARWHNGGIDPLEVLLEGESRGGATRRAPSPAARS